MHEIWFYPVAKIPVMTIFQSQTVNNYSLILNCKAAMKTIKKILMILIIMLTNSICHSYTIHIDKPNSCSDFPSHFIYPVNSIECRFMFETSYPIEEELADCSVYLVQNGNEHLMYTGVNHTGQWISMPVVPTSFPNFCFNETARLRIRVSSYSFPNLYSDIYGYFIIHKPGDDCHFGSLTNGTAVLNLNNVTGTFYRTSSCNTISSSTYFVKQYKVNFTLYGNFTDSIPEVDTNLCWGYNGALPNHQRTWAAKVYQSATEARFQTFAYKITNILGQDLGWVPCSPDEATVVYYYLRRPVIQAMLQWNAPLTPSNPTSYVVCNLQQGNGDLTYEWRDTNGTPSFEFQQVGNYARVTKHFPDHINNESRANQYELCCRVDNGLGFTPWECLVIQVSNSVIQCPVIRFEEDGYPIDENSILIGSKENPLKDIMDNYIMMNPFLAAKEKIEFTIHETEDEQTRIDQISLIQVSTNPGEEISVDQNGDIINYINNAPKASIIKNDKYNISEKLYYNDDEEVELAENDNLKVSFTPDGSGYVVILLRGPLNKDNIVGTINSDGKAFPFYSRDNNNIICMKLEKADLSEFDVNIKQDILINQIAVVKNLNTFYANNLNLKSATIKSKDVNKLISNSDDNYAEISKDNELELEFDTEIISGKNIRYILKTEGRYSMTGEALREVKESGLINKLFDNFPNPFNPVTNILFEIRNDGFVNIKIYDITGKEIETLINEFKKSGRYEITFDGSALPSGIYFYRIANSDYSETKRMILIK